MGHGMGWRIHPTFQSGGFAAVKMTVLVGVKQSEDRVGTQHEAAFRSRQFWRVRFPVGVEIEPSGFFRIQQTVRVPVHCRPGNRRQERDGARTDDIPFLVRPRPISASSTGAIGDSGLLRYNLCLESGRRDGPEARPGIVADQDAVRVSEDPWAGGKPRLIPAFPEFRRYRDLAQGGIESQRKDDRSVLISIKQNDLAVAIRARAFDVHQQIGF